MCVNDNGPVDSEDNSEVIMTRTLGKIWLTIAIVTMVSSVFAQPGERTQNEDMAWIKAWAHSQKVATLASQLPLTADQLTTLRSVKAEMDVLAAEREAHRADHEANLAATAATVRANIEATGEFSDTDKEALKELRIQARAAREEHKLQVELALLPMKDLLTDEQKQIIASVFARGGQGKRQAQRGDNNGQAQEGPGRERKGRKAIVRILLSDDFLSYYE